MIARNYFGEGFLRGLNSVAEVFAPYSGGRERSPLEGMRSDSRNLQQDGRIALEGLLASLPHEVPDPSRPGEGPKSGQAVTRIIAAHWSGPLPPSGELEKIDQIIPRGADRLLRIVEKEQLYRIAEAEKEQAHRIEEAEKKHEDSRRGQYLGCTLAAGAVIAAGVVSVCHAPWQVSVALVGIPLFGAVQALIQGRKE
jgi:uncharacterized membrane protein